jgi:hypothetical protein
MATSVWLKVAKADNADYNILHCGEYCSVHFDASFDQKKFKVNRFFCGKHHKCPICLNKRLSFFKNVLSIPKNMIAITLDDNDKNIDMLKKCYKTYTSVFPRDDGMTTLFVVIQEPMTSIAMFKEFNYVWYQDIVKRELDFIFMTPDGRRVMGLATKKMVEINVILGGTPLPEDNSFPVKVDTSHITCSASDDTLEDIFRSIKASPEYPKNMRMEEAPGIVDKIIQLQNYRLIKALRENGIRYKDKRDSFEFRFPQSMFAKIEEYNQEILF